ncbi:hypothetical protein [Actinoplanes xinjiangensis]|uniref:hypothetical protein n=1 Tax=Actinoplanes xinjiangensis TaxID=512350 RepID=UPI003445A52A
MTDHDRYPGDWDQDALFYGVPSPAGRPDEPTRAAAPSGDRPPPPFDVRPAASPGGPPSPLFLDRPDAAPGDEPTRQVPPSGAYFDPTTMALSGPAAPERLQPTPAENSHRRLPLIVAALAVLLIAGAIGGVVLMQSSDRNDASGAVTEPAPQVTPTETVTTDPTPTETPSDFLSIEATATTDPQEEALAQLEAVRERDLATVTFDGRLVAQIASKYPGISDPYQTAADGSHTFQHSDILAEHQRLRAEHGDADHPVILLKSTDYGKRQLIAGQPLWVTFVVGDFPDKASVRTWCAGHFGHLSATELKNHCDARNLRPAA